MRKIVLITSSQPSLNPRLVKEADALIKAGFAVTIIYQFLNQWGTVMDKVLLCEKDWTAIRVGGSPNENKATYLYSRLVFKIFSILSNCGIYKPHATGRSFNLLKNEAIKHKADLYIAHNLTALPAAVLASKKNNAKCGFDAEDFHRQEVTDDRNSSIYQLTKFIEDKYIPQLDYITAASPLIAEAYQNLYPTLKPVVLNNVFSSIFLQNINPSQNEKGLKLFWFSQTIGKGRGIEDAIKAISSLNKENISLTLLGNVDAEMKAYYLNFAHSLGLSTNQLVFIQPILPDDIFKIANQFDIALALELAIPFNRNICLTNKIFTYLTSGLAIIASETHAQKNIMEENPGIGKSYPIGNVSALAQIINMYDNDRNLLNATKLKSLQVAQEKYNWEQEQKYFINCVSKCLN